MAASLNEAYVRFVSERKTGNKSTEGYQDLGKFVNYFGKDRDVSEILPSEVAEYAQYIGRTVSDPAKRLASVKLSIFTKIINEFT